MQSHATSTEHIDFSLLSGAEADGSRGEVLMIRSPVIILFATFDCPVCTAHPKTITRKKRDTNKSRV